MARSLSDSERSQRGRIAAHTKWSQTNAVEGTAAARAAFLTRFLDEVDPERVLPEGERLRRAEHARSAYMTRLAFKSARARKRSTS